MSLAQIAQDDFAVGTLLGVAPDVQPGVGVAQAIDALINDDGDLYLRGTTGRASTNAPGGIPLAWAWSGKIGSTSYVLAGDNTKLYSMVGSTLTAIPGSTRVNTGARCVVIGSTLYLPDGQTLTDAAGVLTRSSWATPPNIVAPFDCHLATITGRFIVANDNVIVFSSSPTPGAPISPSHFDPTDFHRLPGGVSIRSIYAIQDTLMVFTNYGLWTVTNMSYDLTDDNGNVQQTLSQIVPDLSALEEGGMTPYKGRVVVACTDGIYLVDPINAPTRITDSIAPLWTQMQELLFNPGGAKVYEDTLFLPMITPSVAIGGAQWRVFTCRLNRPTKARHVYYPWTELKGHAAQQSMFDFYDAGFGVPHLLGAGVDGYLNDLTHVLRQDYSSGGDADGGFPDLTIETRDFPTGQGQPNHLKRIRIGYSALLYAADIELDLSYSVDTFHTTWTDLPSQLLVAPGDDPLAEWIQPVKRARYARVRIRLHDIDVGSFVLHRIELQARAAGHGR